MTQKYDVIIIGAGISGAAIAYELAKKGYKTLNLDRLAAAGNGSTGNTCAIIRTHYSTLEGTALAYDSYFYWKEWDNYVGNTDELGLARFYDIGMLVIKPKSFDFSNYLKLHDELNIPYEVWDSDMLLKKMPHFVDDSFYPPKRPEDSSFGEPSTEKINSTVIFFPRGGYINDATLSVHNIQRAAESKGAAFLFNAEVVEIRKDSGKVTGITLKDGQQFHAPVVVNAAGPHSFIINRLAGIEDKMNIKTRALRHEVHFVPSPEEYSYEKEGIIVSDGDAGGYHRPEAGNLVLVGSEDPACDELDWIDDPDNYNRDVTTEQWQAQVYRIAKRIPNLRIPSKPKGIVDLYDVTDDWIPIYDKSDLAGFYLAIGTSGNQYKNGPVIGQLLSEIISACENGHDHDREPVRIKLRNIDFTLDTGIFSRNRDIIKGSTFSVLG
jgi:sarcosine oxidase subunit beta